MKTKMFLLAAAFGSGIAMLGAQDAPKRPQPPGGDGRPGGDPQARFDEAFKKMDANGDGKISKEEFIEFSKKDAEERFSKMDASGTGSLSKEQIGEAMRRSRGGEGGARPEGGKGRPEGFRRPEGGEGGGVRQRPGGDNNQPGGNPPPPPPAGTGNPGGPGGPGGPGERGMRGGGGMGGGSAMGEVFRKVYEGGTVTKEEFLKMSEEGFKKLD
ncbi:MAG TPA: EF-hand domain-containing protein, partial [Verrucomicrobiaceae bacterium]